MRALEVPAPRIPAHRRKVGGSQTSHAPEWHHLSRDGSGPMISDRNLASGGKFAVKDVVERGLGGKFSVDLASNVHCLVFTRSGRSEARFGSRSVLFEPGRVVFVPSGAEFRFRLPRCAEARYTALSFEPQIGDELADLAPFAKTAPAFADVLEGVADPTIYLFQQLIVQQLRLQGELDVVQIQEVGLDLLVRSLQQLSEQALLGLGDVVATNRAHHRRLVNEACMLLAARYSERLSLNDISGSVGVSPYFLSRIFKTVTGVHLHLYLNRIRLRATLERLFESDLTLSEIALDAGFSSHSHFSHVFRREFGMSPSNMRRNVARAFPTILLRQRRFEIAD